MATHLLDMQKFITMQSENLDGDFAAVERAFPNVREVGFTGRRVR
jgi:hypothetical protein